MKPHYINRIKEVYPDLEIEKAEVNDIGQNNDVLIVNDSLIFRFPKYQAGIDNMLKETDILQKLKADKHIPAPVPIYQSFEPLELGNVFTGYRMIEGSPLSGEEFRECADDLILKLRSLSLVNVLIRLHAFPVDEFAEGPAAIHDEYKDLYNRIQVNLYPFMRHDAQENVSKLFEDFFNRIDDFYFTSALIHGDFGASNLLWNSKTFELAGIIDFGESGPGDPAYDFAGILASYGYDFFKRCIDNYHNDDPGMEKRAVFYQKTFALQEALHGVENGDSTAFASGMRGYM
ncbi:aminoglycoside phosphotransferase family protein [Lentibacillus salicampi]|uniref:Aminoglycoside phosphotransferase family protein n=2 Tax=Lentibacillus salicampi TaxID=175306 RepID=A0A4Y9ABH0_9BACI|nr:aminoglycoside phosphotransferase family protein [Lentibacillus salicampi]